MKPHEQLENFLDAIQRTYTDPTDTRAEAIARETYDNWEDDLLSRLEAGEIDEDEAFEEALIAHNAETKGKGVFYRK